MIPLLTIVPYTAATAVPSPNFNSRKAATIEGIVLHATADGGNEAGTVSWMQSPSSAVSSHLLVSRNGDVTRLVGDLQRAWHAGLSWWRGTSDVNSITLGIEIANRNDGEPYTEAQYQRVAEIVAHYIRQGLTLDDVVSHRVIARDRMTDPLGWDWDRFRVMVQKQLRTAEVEVPRQVPVVIQPRFKPIMKSRTFWFNAMTVLATGAVIASDVLDLAFSLGLTPQEEITLWVLFAIGTVNIILRFQTTCPIGSPETINRSLNKATMRLR